MIFKLKFILILIVCVCLQDLFAATKISSSCRSYFIQTDVLSTLTENDKNNLETAAHALSTILGKTQSEDLQVKMNFDSSLLQFIFEKQWNKEQADAFTLWLKERIRFYFHLEMGSFLNSKTIDSLNRTARLKKQKADFHKIKTLMEKYKATNLTEALLAAHKMLSRRTQVEDILFILSQFEHLEITNAVFHVVVQYSNLEAIRYFIDKGTSNGININYKDVKNKGRTALHLAAQKNYHRAVIIKTLLLAGADPSLSDDLGRTPLHFATEKPDTSVTTVQLLLEFGGQSRINSQDENKTTALMNAATGGSLDVVNILLQAGANPDRKDSSGKTALHRAVDSKRIRFHVIIQLLIQADKGAQLNATDNLGNTPLHAAAATNSFLAIKELLSAGANPTLQNNQKQTPYDSSLVLILKSGRTLYIPGRQSTILLGHATEQWKKDHPP